LHYVLRFSDKKYLVIRRSKTNVTFEEGRVSFSGEEQMAPEDADRTSQVEDLTIRALMQEAFHFEYHTLDSTEASLIRSMVEAMRFLSLSLEEKYGQFALLGFVQLNISSERYAEFYKENSRHGLDIDDEGIRYLMGEDDVVRFFENGQAKMRRLTDPQRYIGIALDELTSGQGDAPAQLHSSSLYRMWKVSKLLGIVNR
jgi:hypothetical protein